MNKILIVEDDYTNRYVYKKMLREYELFMLEDCEDIMETIIEFQPDLILLDVMLPKINGFEMAKTLMARENTKYIPIIFVTARDTSEDLEEGLNIGAYDYITKPIDELILKSRIKTTFNKVKRELELYNETITDSLTQVNNRRYFFNRSNIQLEYSIRENKNFSVGMLDIDFFKKINDNYGHLIGDFILKEFAKDIKNSIRPYDLLARYGGEEFVVLLVDCNKTDATNIIERLRVKIENKLFEFDSAKINFTFSCGISDFFENQQEQSIDNILKMADNRMYFAKKNGRNKIIFEDI